MTDDQNHNRLNPDEIFEDLTEDMKKGVGERLNRQRNKKELISILNKEFEIEALQAEQMRKNEETDRALKKFIVSRMFCVLLLWSAFVMLVVTLSGLSWTTQLPYVTFTLNPWFLGTLTSGVIVSILGLFMPIVFGLFSRKR